MSDCCSNTFPETKQTCPECGFTCKSVGMKTLYHQVKFPENQSLITDNYYFCPTKTCSIGYFSSPGNIMSKQHLRNYQAIQNDVLCYCFDIDTNHYLSALKSNCEEPIKDFVIQLTKAKDCACEIKNPSGQCCLINFKRLEESY